MVFGFRAKVCAIDVTELMPARRLGESCNVARLVDSTLMQQKQFAKLLGKHKIH